MKFQLNLCPFSLFLLIMPARSPPSAYSITMLRVLFFESKKALWQAMTLGESMLARRRIQLRAESFSFSVRLAILMILMARNPSSVPLGFTLMTLPKDPLPSSFIKSYRSIEDNSNSSKYQQNFEIITLNPVNVSNSQKESGLSWTGSGNSGAPSTSPRNEAHLELLPPSLPASLSHNPHLLYSNDTSDAGQIIHYVVGQLAILLDLLGVLLRHVSGFFSEAKSPFEVREPDSEFGLSGFTADLEEEGVGRGVEFEFVLHGDDGFGKSAELVKLFLVVVVVVFQLLVQFGFFLGEFLLELHHDVADLFLDLEFDCVYVILDRVKVLLLLFLPLQQALHSLCSHHLSEYRTRCLLLSVNPHADFLYSPTQLNHAQLVSVMSLFVPVAAAALFAKERPAFAFGLCADVSEYGFLMFGAPQGQSSEKRVFKHLKDDVFTIMLRKKNYKEEDHFSQYYSVLIPRPNGAKLTLYFKRYRPPQKQPTSIYQTIHASGHQLQEQAMYPVDRTLEGLSFDGDLQSVQALFRKVGKIRKFLTGEGKYQNKKVHYCIVIFKFEYDLVKCFLEDYLQNMANQLTSKVRPQEEQVEEQRRELIIKHLPEQLRQVQELQALHEEGFNPVTNKFGEFKVDYEANQKLVEELPQTKRKKKLLDKRAREQAEKEKDTLEQIK